MNTEMTVEQRAEARGLVLRKGGGKGGVKTFVDVTINGEKLTFDGPNAEEVLNDAIVYLDIADSEGVFRIDYNEDTGLYSVTLAGTGEVFENESPVDAFEEAKAAHEEYQRQEEAAEKARAAQAKADKPEKVKKPRKPKPNDAIDDKGRLRPTQEEADATTGQAEPPQDPEPQNTPLATELDEKDWEKAQPEFVAAQPTERTVADMINAGYDQIINGLLLLRDAQIKNLKDY